MIPLLATFLSIGTLEASTTEKAPPSLEIPVPQPVSKLDEKIQNIFRKIPEKTIYFYSGMALGSASLLARLGWGVCLISPWASTAGNECLLLSHVCGSAAKHVFTHIFKGSPSSHFKNISPSQNSWYHNKMLLSEVPAVSREEKNLLLFLEKRWLAKSSGIYPLLVDWVCPCFGISVQVHPETTGFYARNPGQKFSEAYKNRVDRWKQTLPHPRSYPLILTRPADLRDYLPSFLDVPSSERIQTTVERLSSLLGSTDVNVVVDLTHIFPDDVNNSEKWIQIWDAYQVSFSQACKEHNLNLNRLLCIQKVHQEEIGGIRLLPLVDQSAKVISEHHQYLLEWISNFGLSANRVELDRWPVSFNNSIRKSRIPSISMKFHSKQEFVSFLDSFDQNWKSAHPQKTLMFKGTLQLLKGLLASLSIDKWDEIINSPTQSAIVLLSFIQIEDQLNLLAQEENEVPFFETASHIEQIHNNLSTLLEIFSPFTYDDFSQIYRNLQTSIPLNLKPLSSYAIHSSGMTSLAGIFNAVKKAIGRPPRVLYGENSYFENIYAAQKVSHASPIEEATETDWKDVDLILAQFNPALRRIDFQITEYKVERIAEDLRKALNAREGKPITLAIDCTFDFIDSPRVGRLLTEFQKEIEIGTLNIICYRSGLKFDLFGMDNYCGAPFFMIHNQDAKWASFDTLPNDPALQTERLSLNWFCLAYQSAAPYLELYRKQIFDNTRALLDKVPTRLLKNRNADYRIIPMENDADLAFIDIKVFGSFHQIRASLLVGGFLTIHCMKDGHPIFYRPSVGFYHPNFTLIYGEECSTIRLTLGLDPAQVDLIAEGFEMIDTLNGSPWYLLLDMVQEKIHIPSPQSLKNP